MNSIYNVYRLPLNKAVFEKETTTKQATTKVCSLQIRKRFFGSPILHPIED